MMRFAPIILMAITIGTRAISGEVISCESKFTCKPNGICTATSNAFELISTDESDGKSGLHFRQGTNVNRLGQAGNIGYNYINRDLEGFQINFFGDGNSVWIPIGDLEDHIQMGTCK